MENCDAIYVSPYTSKFYLRVFFSNEATMDIGEFETKEEAQAYLSKGQIIP